MAKLLTWFRNRLPTQRRLIQLYTALLYNAHTKGFITGSIYTGNNKMLCVPGLNCYSCPGATGACPLGALQNAVASSGSRVPTYIVGILMLYGLILGRTICGFLCPFGLIQELLHKIPTPKVHKSGATRMLSLFKYVILIIFVILIPLIFALQSYPVPAFCKYICPAGTFEGAFALLAHPVNADKFPMLGFLFTWKFLVMLLIMTACVFVYRAFCRFLCPLGAIYGLFARYALIGVKVESAKCIDCGRCLRHCKMDIHHVGDHECIHCGECITTCPTKAISFKAGKYTLSGPAISCSEQPGKQPRTALWRFVAWSTALLLLSLALYAFNQPEANAHSANSNTNSTTISATAVPDVLQLLPVGKDVGMLAPDFTVPVYGAERPFVLSEHRGKVVVINFWATWCGPCCKELPYFDTVYQNHKDEVTVVAIHSDLVTDDIPAYLANYEYTIPFALDETGEVIQLYGGAMMLPQTIIVDPNGVITYNAVGSLTLEKLQNLVDNALHPVSSH